jgi:PAS domain S-box-containing protein
MRPRQEAKSQLRDELREERPKAVGAKTEEVEHKRQGEALRGSKGTGPCLVNGLSETVLTVSRDGTILSINLANGVRHFEEVPGTKLWDYVAPSVRDRTIDAVETVFRSGEPQRYETALAQLDGSQVWHEFSVAPFQRNDEVVSAVLVVRDITERKRREEARDALATLSTRLAATASPETIITIVREETEHLWHWDAHHITLRLPGEDVFRVVCHLREMDEKAASTYQEERPAARLSGSIQPALEGHPVLINQAQERPDPVLHQFGDKLPPAASIMHVPIRNGENATGVLSVQSETQGRYDQVDLEALQKFADAIGPALERAYAETSLRQSEERYRLLAEKAADLLWTMDMNLRLTYISPSITRIRGYTVNEAMGLSVQDILTPHSYQLAMKTLREELESEKRGNRDSAWSRTMELQHVCKDGSTVWSEAKMTFLRDPYGRPVGILGVTRDITDRKRAEEALRHSEEKYRMLIDNMQDGVFIIQDGKMQFVNEALARMVGYEVEEVSGKEFLRLVAPEDRELVGVHLGRMEAGKDVAREYEFRMLHRDRRTKVTVSMNVGAITFCGRAASIGTVKDITQRKQAEEEKGRLQEQLAHAQKIEALGTLAGGIAHEFNNINAAIIGYIDLLFQTEQLPETVRRKLEIVRGSAARGADLTKSLLTFSTRDIVEKIPVDLRSVVDEVLRVTQNEFTSEGIELTVRHTTRVPQVMGDAGMLASVVMNLAVNARHAMLRSKVKRLTIQTGVDEGRPFIVVEDTGCGIPKKYLSRLFDPFFTTKGSLVGGGIYDGKAQGTGLGLSVCHSIIERHSGEIRVKSQVGKGATFTIYFPAPSKRRTTRRTDQGRPEKAPFRIMVVDDEEAITDLLVEVLGHAGYEADGFTNPTEALEVLGREPYALAFIDLQMPEMAGEAFMKAIDHLPPGQQPLKVVVTGRLDSSGKSCVPTDVFGALPKPFTTQQVLGVIERGVAVKEGKPFVR